MNVPLQRQSPGLVESPGLKTLRKQDDDVAELQADCRTISDQPPPGMVTAVVNDQPAVANAAYRQLWNLGYHDLAACEAMIGGRCHQINLLPHLDRLTAGKSILVGPHLTGADRTVPYGEEHWVTAVGYPMHDAAGQVTNAVIVHQNAASIARLERVERGRASVLARTLEALANEPSLDSFIGQVLAVLIERLPAESASLWLVEPATGEANRLFHSDHLGLRDGSAMSRLSAIPSKVKPENLTDLDRLNVIRHYKDDLAVLPRYQAFKKAGDARGIQSTAFLPLLNRGVFRGWIVLTFKTEGSLLQEDEPFAVALANQAVFALELTRVAKEARQAAIWRERDDAAEKRAAALADANRFLRDAIANLHTLEHLDTFLLKMLAATDRILEGEYAALFLLDTDSSSVEMRHLIRDGAPLDISGQPGAGSWLEAARIDKHSYAEVWSKSSQAPGYWWLAADDAQPLPASFAWLKRTGNAAIAHVPLWWGQELLGFIAVVFSTAERPPDAKLETAQMLAQQISMAHEVARLGVESRQMAVTRELEAAADASAKELARANAALARSTAELSMGGDLDTYLARLLYILLELMECQSGSLWLMQPDGMPQLRLKIEDGLSPPSSTTKAAKRESLFFKRELVLSNGSNMLGRDKMKRLPNICEDIATSVAYEGAEDIRTYMLSRNIRARMIIFILTGDRHLGSFTVRASIARTWTAEQVELAQSLGNQAALAIEMKRLTEDARQAAVEAERNRFARDIHDTLAQDFIAIAAHLQSAQRKMTASRLRPADIAGATTAVEIAFKTAQDGLLQARRSVWSLTPRALEAGAGLASALRDAIGMMPAGRIEMMERGSPGPLPVGVEVEMLSIAREAIGNALRHAGPTTRIIACVSHEPLGVRLAIEDDGHGFDPQSVKNQQQGHFGLWAMQERAARIGGHFDLISSPGGGTQVTVFVPLDTGVHGHQPH